MSTIYVASNTGTLVKASYDYETAHEVYAKQMEEESHYKWTHAYPHFQEMEVEDFVCEYICEAGVNAIRRADEYRNFPEGATFKEIEAKRHELYEEYLHAQCRKCPFYKEGEDEN